MQDPDVYRPERHLTPDGKFKGPNEHVNLFGMGRRKCVGERLGSSTTFLFCVSIFQFFSVHEV